MLKCQILKTTEWIYKEHSNLIIQTMSSHHICNTLPTTTHFHGVMRITKKNALLNKIATKPSKLRQDLQINEEQNVIQLKRVSVIHTSDSIAKYFSKFGKVVQVKLSKSSSISQIGFVTFEKKESLAHALAAKPPHGVVF
ncbi:hypothetical protein EIN_168130 [Entamoeba invadens IP1]|uniref:RRM domain-containing protein n=1 Tax=Entamoeba invadens IP1 TaxID=370355 RepID=A0A0A1U0Q4_ENTIV|nr:hypothetical protein EIN_168130 [Entamoeba invadens IP1]ELP84458.1 hypothetical protein EIN_168130 [Entamoeba invadens IP1]|eukprot:XP_004183804.1 hypothetical protein EIN_168130 [Entamoeba invadens IP1]